MHLQQEMLCNVDKTDLGKTRKRCFPILTDIERNAVQGVSAFGSVCIQVHGIFFLILQYTVYLQTSLTTHHFIADCYLLISDG